MQKKIILIILDGWGIASDKKVSAIDRANTPFVDSLYKKYPHSSLQASGMAVGLPEGQMGNSEVGHMNIGAGRVVYQMLVRINQILLKGALSENTALQDTFEYTKSNSKKLHLIGLVSDGGVHAHINHLKGLLSAAHAAGLTDVFVHAFTDGRDTDPKSALGFITDLEEYMQKTTGKIASITGRYYAMDRDKRWERIRLAYQALVHGKGKHTSDIKAAVMDSYEQHVTDEFIKPIIHTDSSHTPLGLIEPNDAVICFNFRTDRGRQITQALTQEDFPNHNMQRIDLHYITMTNYDENFQNVQVMFENQNLINTLGEVLQRAGKKQIRIAETEKYPHVTFFFSGGQEAAFQGEKRILCSSPKVATYDLQPEMSAHDIKDKIIVELENQTADFICLNFANPDMVGHTGVFHAAVKACETTDICAEAVVNSALKNGYTSLVVADHGNSDVMINPDGSPNTAHTNNLVPCILVDATYKGKIKDGKLGDLAPTILHLMGVDTPDEMTGLKLL